MRDQIIDEVHAQSQAVLQVGREKGLVDLHQGVRGHPGAVIPVIHDQPPVHLRRLDHDASADT